MRKIDWNSIQERQEGEFNSPAPGGYIAVIRRQSDNEAKEYLEICWDFAEGDFKGYNQDTFDRAQFWPTRLFRSYKQTALPFFKAFKTALEESNPGYQFQEDNLQALIGKYLGVVLGEEEYIKNDGTVGTRMYVAQVRSGQAIRAGDFKVPELKRVQKPKEPEFKHVDDIKDEELPF